MMWEAHTGEYSQLLIKIFHGCAYTIHSFEPSQTAFSNLIKNMKDYPAVLAYNLAVGRKSYQTLLLNSGSKIAALARWDEQAGESSQSGESVRVINLDSFCNEQGIEQIDFLKIDVEGYEYEVLEGAQTLLHDERIHFIQFEFGYASVLSQSGRYFRDYYKLLAHKFYIYRIVKDGLVLLGEPSAWDEIYVGGNFLAERKHKLTNYS
ncbi:MAG: FkbM family methyltransferase [Bacteroidia bacterium]|nr:FkbM family methyltransferase [Bacteroidia bacterium]